MYGAIIGDIAGSIYEGHNIKTKQFPFISEGCRFTDDTVMTVAVAKALLRYRNEYYEGGLERLKAFMVQEMQTLGRKYPYAGYGGNFFSWLHMDRPRPYNSYGNGSAMRVSPCGLFAVTIEEAVAFARASAEVTHNHPEGIKGAEATAAAIFLARAGRTKEQIRSYICEHYYDLTRTLDEIRPAYSFFVSCQQTVPQAITAFLESTSYEDAVRNAISLGGDTDTLAAITGAIAWSYYRFRSRDNTGIKEGRIWPAWCQKILQDYQIDAKLPDDFVRTIDLLDMARAGREGY